MKKILFAFSLILIGLFIFGCTSGENSGTNGSVSAQAICGNGVLETGETQASCCQDAGCNTFFQCKELENNGAKLNTCVKQKIDETKEYKSFLSDLAEESAEYDKEASLVNYDFIATKIESMQRNIAKLEQVYDTNLEKAYIEYRSGRREWNIKRTSVMDKIEIETDKEKQKDLVNQLITLDEGEKVRLNSFTPEQKESIEDKFDYDIIEKVGYLDEEINLYKDVLRKLDLDYKITLSVVDYDPSCSSWSGETSCFLDYVKIKIKNEGELEIANPTFDFYIMKGDQVISREIDVTSWDLTSVPLNYEGIFKETYVGYDEKSELTPGTYNLKVSIKEGISTQAIASVTTSIKLN